MKPKEKPKNKPKEKPKNKEKKQQESTILYPGLRHEILNETAHRQTVYGDLLHWLEDRLG